MELSEASILFAKNTPLSERKKLGQYMTPTLISEKAAQALNITENNKEILDPAVGTGELLKAIQQQYVDKKFILHGWDVDNKILKYANQNFSEQEAFIKNCDTLSITGDPEKQFDYIISNPPYFELKLSKQQRNYFKEVVNGRANIYALFFKQIHKLLKDEGKAAVIVPPSMNTGKYFSNLRSFILDNFNILDIISFNDNSLFTEAQTAVQIIVLQKTREPKINPKKTFDLTSKIPYELSCKGEGIFFSSEATVLKKFWKGKTTIHELGYDVKTGPLVWNEYKDSFCSTLVENSFIVYYSKDLQGEDKPELKESLQSRRYLKTDTKKPLKGEAILVNRIVGSVGAGSLKASLVDGSYYAENHVNVITSKDTPCKQKCSLKDLHGKLVTDEEISEYVKAFTGSTQISATELNFLIPIKR